MGHKIISVYRDDPEWEKHNRWWQLGAAKLAELSVCEWTCNCDNESRCDRPYPDDVALAEKTDPGCIYVYIDR